MVIAASGGTFTHEHTVASAAPVAGAGAATASASSSTGSMTVVIKLGTSSILDESTMQPKLSLLASIVEVCRDLRSDGHRVVLVCSGAIGVGRARMKMTERPKGVAERQALAALGQLRLMALWDNLFHTLGIDVAQVLLTRNDIADRPRYLNARTTLSTLLSAPFCAVPIVNENDTVSVSELRFGDNDTLSAITAGLVDADFLFLCTDVDGLYTGNPRNDPTARRLHIVKNVVAARRKVDVSTAGTNFGTGGMQTKLIAAELATAAGVATVILNSESPANIRRIVTAGRPDASLADDDEGDEQGTAGEDVVKSRYLAARAALPPHTIFLPSSTPLPSRKWSILHALHPAGALVIDEGAYRRILRPEAGGRILPAGVCETRGSWERMQALRLVVRKRREDNAEAKGTAPLGSRDTTVATTTMLSSSASKSDGTSTPSFPTLQGAPLPPSSMSSSIASLVEAGAAEGVAAPSGTSSPGTTVASEDTRRTNADASASDSLKAKLSLAALEELHREWEYREVGRALANYNSIESERIKGIKSSQIAAVLGYADSDYVTDQVALHAVWIPYEGGPL